MNAKLETIQRWREKAEHRANVVEAKLGDERQLRREAERRAKDCENRLGKWVRKLAHSQNSVTWLEAQYNRLQNERARAHRERDDWCERAERAEALATLVTLEVAALLERLAGIVDSRRGLGASQTTHAARALAAQIREALEATE